jgi:hypothetical protein
MYIHVYTTDKKEETRRKPFTGEEIQNQNQNSFAPTLKNAMYQNPVSRLPSLINKNQIQTQRHGSNIDVTVQPFSKRSNPRKKKKKKSANEVIVINGQKRSVVKRICKNRIGRGYTVR